KLHRVTVAPMIFDRNDLNLQTLTQRETKLRELYPDTLKLFITAVTLCCLFTRGPSGCVRTVSCGDTASTVLPRRSVGSLCTGFCVAL
ncbi:hypothetical protein XENOCAPTIV_021168, partial [Xenoophorus captivus]